MPILSQKSLAQLATCHPDLQRVVREAIKYFDFTVIEGHRGKDAQEAAYAKGLTKVRWPNGKHNQTPSLAVDIAPYPIDWSESKKAHERFVYMAGIVMATAARMGVRLRWGGDWNQNQDMRDEGFRDYPHFELVLPKPAPVRAAVPIRTYDPEAGAVVDINDHAADVIGDTPNEQPPMVTPPYLDPVTVRSFAVSAANDGIDAKAIRKVLPVLHPLLGRVSPDKAAQRAIMEAIREVIDALEGPA